MPNKDHSSATAAPPLSDLQRAMVAIAAILAWLCAGLLLAVPPLASNQAVASMGVGDKALQGRWFSLLVCAALLGAALGGLVFGWLGDRIGRSRALGLSVLVYSLFAGAAYYATTPDQLLAVWFLASTGVGGAWPNGVSLTSEMLPGVSRPAVAGLFGAAANLGMMALSYFAKMRTITETDWRWILLVCASPAVLGALILAALPESAQWLAQRQRRKQEDRNAPPASLLGEVFRPPFLKYTILGIALGAIPLIGNWGSSNWLVPWAKTAASAELSADTQWQKSSGGLIGSLVGGAMASLCGRRTAYFLMSAAALGSSSYIFHYLKPGDESFLAWVFIQGFCGTIYFGWLPLYLPELFPTRVRATGTGVAFNWGRIVTAFGVLLAGQLMVYYEGDYARVGQVTCLIYALGMIVIFFAPDTSKMAIQSSGSSSTGSSPSGSSPLPDK